MIQLIDAVPPRAYDWAGYGLTQHAQHAADVHTDRIGGKRDEEVRIGRGGRAACGWCPLSEWRFCTGGEAGREVAGGRSWLWVGPTELVGVLHGR